ncbi:hypothetical protein ACJX0J_040841, partial [Zea mays]
KNNIARLDRLIGQLFRNRVPVHPLRAIKIEYNFGRCNIINYACIIVFLFYFHKIHILIIGLVYMYITTYNLEREANNEFTATLGDHLEVESSEIQS